MGSRGECGIVGVVDNVGGVGVVRNVRLLVYFGVGVT